MHLEIVLLSPGWLRGGHLRQEKEIPSFLRCIAGQVGYIEMSHRCVCAAVNSFTLDERFDGCGESIVVQGVAQPIITTPGPGPQPPLWISSALNREFIWIRGLSITLWPRPVRIL